MKKYIVSFFMMTLMLCAEHFQLLNSGEVKHINSISCQISKEPVVKAGKKPMSRLKNFFISRDDMCEGNEIFTCTNGFESVRNLQIALNADHLIDIALVTDGKWGDKTKNAVMAYQKIHHIKPIDGWVGGAVKRSLDKTAKDVAYPSDFFSRQEDMCEGSEDHNCTNDYNAVRNLQIALNHEKALGITLKVDGEWGENTKKAVMKYQEEYKLTPVDGWVGRDVKEKLDHTSKGIVFPKNKIHEDEEGDKDKTITKKQSSQTTQAKHQTSVKKAKITKAHVKHLGSYEAFKKHVNLRKSFKVYKNASLLRQSTRRNTKLLIDVSTQRLTMFVKGKVALSSPCTTGAKHKFEPNTKIYRDKHTPLGNFKILEKIRDKRSTIFGDYYRNGKRIYHGDRRKFRGNKHGARYVGASLMYWMRLTSGGVGLHASKYVKRYPGTNGCIRLPKHIAKLVFSKVSVGTRVKVQP